MWEIKLIDFFLVISEHSAAVIKIYHLETQKLAQTHAHHHVLVAEDTAKATIRMENSPFQVLETCSPRWQLGAYYSLACW